MLSCRDSSRMSLRISHGIDMPFQNKLQSVPYSVCRRVPFIAEFSKDSVSKQIDVFYLERTQETCSTHQLGLERTQGAANLPRRHDWLHKYLPECSDCQCQQTVSSLKYASLQEAVMKGKGLLVRQLQLSACRRMTRLLFPGRLKG